MDIKRKERTMTYKTEFPEFPDADIPSVFLAAPWRDQSWHNDACPSFARSLDDGKGCPSMSTPSLKARDVVGKAGFALRSQMMTALIPSMQTAVLRPPPLASRRSSIKSALCAARLRDDPRNNVRRACSTVAIHLKGTDHDHDRI